MDSLHAVPEARPTRSLAATLLLAVAALCAVVTLHEPGFAPAPAHDPASHHLMGWLLNTLAPAEAFSVAPAVATHLRPTTSPSMMAPAVATPMERGEQLDAARDRLEQSVGAGPGARDVARATAQLQALLAVDDVAAMEAKLKEMVAHGDIDSGFFYALARNMELAQRAGDSGDAQLMWHLHTQLAQEVEAQVVGPFFDQTFAAVLAEAAQAGMAAAVDRRLGKLDVAFLPELRQRLAVATGGAREQLQELQSVLEQRSARRFERTQAQMQELLSTGDLDALDAKLVNMARNGDIDTGFFFTLVRSMEAAERIGSEDGQLLMSYLNLRLQEELAAQPARALVRELLRGGEQQAELLAQHLAPQETLPLPAGGAMPLENAVTVEPVQLALALDDAHAKVAAAAAGGSAAAGATVSALQKVAQDAHAVLLETHSAETTNAFAGALNSWARVPMVASKARGRLGAPTMTASLGPTGLGRSSLLASGMGKILRQKVRVGDGALAGDLGFDPLRLSRDPASLAKYREAEIRHARLAMLAALGWPAAEVTNFGNLLLGDGRAPSLLSGGLGDVNYAYWGAVVALAAGAEAAGLTRAREATEEYVPGDLGLDLFRRDSRSFRDAEIWNGRLAMVAITAFAFEEFVSKAPIFPINPCVFGWCLDQVA